MFARSDAQSALDAGPWTVALIVGLGVMLTGCSGYVSEAPSSGGSENPAAMSDGMDLVGTWAYRSHREVSQDENSIRGRLTIDAERCVASSSSCELTGQVEFPAPVDRLEDQVYEIHGRSYPDDGFVKFSYTVPSELLSDDRLRVEVTLDRMPTTDDHPRAMAGYTVIFNQDRPGKQFDDWDIIDAAGRGIVDEAGRVTAWPAESE